MAEALAARTPLHGLGTVRARGVTLRELPPRAQVDLRVDPAAVPAIPLPVTANTTLRAGERAVLWLGPDEWLVTGPDGTQGAIERELRDAIAEAGTWGAVVDVSAQRATLELRGPHARDVLATGCSIDLHPRAFGPGRCAQTQLARTAAILHQVDDEPAYELSVGASFAAHQAAWLRDAMDEYREG